MLLSLLRMKIPLILEWFYIGNKNGRVFSCCDISLIHFCRKYGFLDDWLLNLRHKSVIEYVFGIRDLVIIILNMMYDIVLIVPYLTKAFSLYGLIAILNVKLNYNNFKQKIRRIGPYLEKLMVS